MKKLYISLFVLIISANSYAYDYINSSKISTQKESCKMYKAFNLKECKKQAATVRDSSSRPNCEMWNRQRKSALLECEGKSPRALAEKKLIEKRINLQKNATHILVDKGRLVCLSEKSLRKTYNSLLNKEIGTPRHIRSGVCSILGYETIVKINSLSKDKKVAGIEYLDKYATAKSGFTSIKWLVTKEQYKEIVKKRRSGQM